MTSLDPLDSSSILDRIRADLIVRALTKEEEKEGRFWKHPFVRLAMPFLLTTVVGTWLANTWQTREWTEQQEYAARQQVAKTRMRLMTNFVRELSELVAAGDDVIVIYQHELDLLPETRQQQMDARMKRWFEQSLRWRVEEKVLVAEIRANFSDSRIPPLLISILDERREFSKAVNTFLSNSGGKPLREQPPREDPLLRAWYKNKFADPHNTIVTHSRAITGGTKQVQEGLLARLCTIMIDETRREQNPGGHWPREIGSISSTNIVLSAIKDYIRLRVAGVT